MYNSNKNPKNNIIYAKTIIFNEETLIFNIKNKNKKISA